MTRRMTLPPAPKSADIKAVAFGAPAAIAGHRVILYGAGGIGKTTLAACAPGPVIFFDLDDSLSRLQIEGAPNVVQNIETWGALRRALQAPGWDGVGTLVIDSATRAEELCVQHTLETVMHDKTGHRVASLEGYGFGKGLTYVFESFLPLLADLDTHCRAARHVVLICHDCTTTFPNPQGEDWLRYEPRLQSPNSGKASIRLRAREWADHMLFYGYDVAVKDGKGQGSGTRTVYPTELPHCMAKSRTLSAPVAVDVPGPELWEALTRGAKG